jgi:iron complex outermembrane receptor protein
VPADTDEGSFGASFTGDEGYLGFAISRTEREYGVPTLHLADGELPVHIDLQRNRYETAGEWRPGGAVERIRFSAAHADYGHNELERRRPARRSRWRRASPAVAEARRGSR